MGTDNAPPAAPTAPTAPGNGPDEASGSSPCYAPSEQAARARGPMFWDHLPPKFQVDEEQPRALVVGDLMMPLTATETHALVAAILRQFEYLRRRSERRRQQFEKQLRSLLKLHHFIARGELTDRDPTLAGWRAARRAALPVRLRIRSRRPEDAASQAAGDL